MLKAIVFDFDGVIIDTESEWYYIYRDWLKKDYNYDLKIEDYQICVGANNRSLFEFLKRDIGEHVDTGGFEQGAMQEYIRRTRELPPMKGVLEFIYKAKARGLKLAIATSATLQKPQFHLKRLLWRIQATGYWRPDGRICHVWSFRIRLRKISIFRDIIKKQIRWMKWIWTRLY